MAADFENLSKHLVKTSEIHEIMETAINSGSTGQMVMTGQSTYIHSSWVQEGIRLLIGRIVSEFKIPATDAEVAYLAIDEERLYQIVNEFLGDKLK